MCTQRGGCRIGELDMEVQYIWRVILGDRTTEVKGRDRLEATKNAARALDVRWSKTARDMEVLRLRRA